MSCGCWICWCCRFGVYAGDKEVSYLFPDCVLLIFCKAPLAGQVKTRLQPALSADEAVAAHIELTLFTLNRAFEIPLCPVRLYCAPDPDHSFFQQCAADYPLTLHPQIGLGLGERMQATFSEVLHEYSHALLMGCDCPSLTADDLQESFTALREGADLLIAPAEDGGYVMIGMSELKSHMFSNMPWGSNAVLAETRRRAAVAQLNLQELATQWDVDTVADWLRFKNGCVCVSG